MTYLLTTCSRRPAAERQQSDCARHLLPRILGCWSAVACCQARHQPPLLTPTAGSAGNSKQAPQQLMSSCVAGEINSVSAKTPFACH